MENMTHISRRMYNDATAPMSVADAAALLHRYGQYRTLGDTIRAFAGCDNPKTILVEGLLAADPDAKRDSMDRKVRNWLNGRTGTIDKMDAFELARILGLDLERTDEFLKLVTGEGIHWRDPEEIIRAYAVINGLDHGQTRALLERWTEGSKGVGKVRGQLPDSFTADVRSGLTPFLYGPADALLAHLEQARGTLGTFHNTAHRLFLRYLELLESGGTGSEMAGESKMSAQAILDSYMYRRLVPVARRGQAREKELFSGLQRSIRVSWPDEATLSKMKNREQDVTRKALILLFLATDGSESEFEELDEDEDILTRDEIFLNIYTRINLMLQACGFQQLDPRSPFDWMVLYCICVDDLWDVDNRLRDMLQAIFPDGNEKQ